MSPVIASIWAFGTKAQICSPVSLLPSIEKVVSEPPAAARPPCEGAATAPSPPKVLVHDAANGTTTTTVRKPSTATGAVLTYGCPSPTGISMVREVRRFSLSTTAVASSAPTGFP